MTAQHVAAGGMLGIAELSEGVPRGRMPSAEADSNSRIHRAPSVPLRFTLGYHHTPFGLKKNTLLPALVMKIPTCLLGS